jgi:hypothetical protein
MTTTNTPNDAPIIDAALDHVKDLGEQVQAVARKAGGRYVDAYEKTVDRAIDLESQLAGTTKQDWLKSLIDAQTDFTRELTASSARAARSLLK